MASDIEYVLMAGRFYQTTREVMNLTVRTDIIEWQKDRSKLMTNVNNPFE